MVVKHRVEKQCNNRLVAKNMPLHVYQHLFDGLSSPLSLFLLFFSLVLICIKRSNHKNSQLPPSPPKLPFLGNLHQLGSLPHRSLCDLSKKHGPLMLLHLGQVPTLVVSSAAAAQEIMRAHDIVFASRPSLLASRTILYGDMDMIFAPYGEYWRQLRKLCATHLLSSKMVRSFRSVRVEEVGSMITKISQLSIQGPVDMSDVLYSYTNNIICRALSRKVSAQKGRNELFREMIEENAVSFGRFAIVDYFPKLWWLDVFIGAGARAKRTAKKWDNVLDQVLDAHGDKIVQRKGGEHAADDFVDVLLSLRTEYGLTRDQMKAILLDMFAAGTETTSAFLEWSLAELTKRPEVMKKLQEEVRGSVSRGKAFVEEDELSKMSYLKAVIKEALRLHPVAALSVPRVSRENCRIAGYEIPSKTKVLINIWAICRDPESWEAPDEFRPERFMNSPIDYKGNDFQFIPFGAGRRICPGMNFAAVSAELALANLIYRFDWELPDGMTVDDLDMSDNPGITTRMKHALHLVPKFRSF